MFGEKRESYRPSIRIHSKVLRLIQVALPAYFDPGSEGRLQRLNRLQNEKLKREKAQTEGAKLNGASA